MYMILNTKSKSIARLILPVLGAPGSNL